MSIETVGLHPALAAITEEEQVWQAIHPFNGPSNAVVEVGRTDEAYYQRKLDVCFRAEDIEPRLAALKPEPIGTQEALRLRRRHDAQWRARPMLQRTFASFYQHDFFHEDDEGNLRGIAPNDDPHSFAPDVTLHVARDGGLKVRADFVRKSRLTRDALDWREYRLMRGTSACEHWWSDPTEGKFRTTAYDGMQIIRYTEALVGVIEERLATRDY